LDSFVAIFEGVKKAVDSQCQAFQQAIEVLGRPWTALILNVLQARPLRFSEISTAAQGPGDKVLSARLKDLEGNGLVVRQVHPGPPVRVTYELTERGHGFHDVASAIERWGRCLASAPERQAKPRPTAGPETGGRVRLVHGPAGRRR
jgi:DNA-binding HxlR family transcriptional regulator